MPRMIDADAVIDKLMARRRHIERTTNKTEDDPVQKLPYKLAILAVDVLVAIVEQHANQVVEANKKVEEVHDGN